MIRLIRHFRRVQQPSENPSLYKAYWFSTKEKAKELLREHKIAFVATRALFNISIFYGVGNLIVYNDIGMESISFVRKGFLLNFNF